MSHPFLSGDWDADGIAPLAGSAVSQMVDFHFAGVVGVSVGAVGAT